jgi:hypothetical protein
MARMQAIYEAISQELDGLTSYIVFSCDDNIMSSVWIRGTKEPRTEWAHGIFYNATGFQFMISAAKGKRYYDEGDKLTVELTYKGTNTPPFRKYTGPVEKVIARIKAWIEVIKD